MNITFYDKVNRPWTFLHVPKTAGKSISAYIMEHSKNAKTLHPTSHATLTDMQSLDVDIGTTFAVFRNPYSRAVSLYRFLFEVDIRQISNAHTKFFQKKPDYTWHDELIKSYKGISFTDFCKELPYLPLGIEQHHFFPVAKVLKVENLKHDFKFIQNMLGTTQSLFKFNSTGRHDWRTYYNKQTQEAIYKTYEEDFRLLGYSKDINNSSI